MLHSDLWVRLAIEDRHDLIKKLNRAERREEGFETIVVPKEGFSDDDSTHNMVLDWLEEHEINVLNVGKEIRLCEVALHGYQEEC